MQRAPYVAILVMIMLGPATAVAAPGEHIIAGDAVITPKIDLGLEYRTNGYRREANAFATSNIRVAPGFEVSAKGAQTELEASGTSELRYTLVSGADNRANLDRFSDFNVTSALRLLTEQAVQFQFTETAGLRNNIVAAGLVDNPFNTQFRNDLAFKVPIRVGPTLEFAPRGGWGFDEFRVPDYSQPGTSSTYPRHLNSRNALTGGLDGKFTFLPRTAAIFEGDYTFNGWSHNIVSARDPNDSGSAITVPNSSFVKLSAGLRGRFTKNMVLVLTGGWGMGNYSASGGVPAALADMDVRGFDRFRMLLQAKQEFAKDNVVTAGYRRDFDDSWFTNYVAYNYLYVRSENRIGEHVYTTAEAGVRFEKYAGEVARGDTVPRIKGDVAYTLQNWLSVSGGVWFDQRASDDYMVEYTDVNIHMLMNVAY